MLFDADGKVVAATLPDERRRRFAASAKGCSSRPAQLGDGRARRSSRRRPADGSVFVVRTATTMIAAVDRPSRPPGSSSTTSRVLRAVAEPTREAEAAKPKPKPKPKPRMPRRKSNGTS